MTTPNKERKPPFFDALAEHCERSKLWTIIRYALGGAAVGLLLSGAAALAHHCVELTTHDDTLRRAFLGSYFYAALLIPACIFISLKAALVRFLDSRRLDLALATIIGVGAGFSFHSLAAKYTVGAISELSAKQLFCLFIFPLALLTIFLASALRSMRALPATSSHATFFSDGELKSTDEDMLDVRPDAERFAERVLNGGSKESMVFGLGLHDVLIFRLYSCADKASSLFNLTRAVGMHSDSTTPKAGVLTDIVRPQMREMSQTIFRKFKAQYIETKKNIFSLHRNLSAVDLSGDFFAALQAALARGELTGEAIDDAAERCASFCISFSVSQLTNRQISSGIGCGYYDEVGNKDENGIHLAMNDYIFGVCFSEANEDEGVLTFLDFALSQFRTDFGRRKKSFVPDLKELLTIFDADRLRTYWLANRGYVKANLVTIDRVVRAYAYTANYQEYLPPLIEVLDQFTGS